MPSSTGHTNILFSSFSSGTIFQKRRQDIMVTVNIVELLRKKGKSKYWLCQKMNLTSRNLNRIIRGETTSISFKYMEEFCENLDCTPGELFQIEQQEKTSIR